MTGVKEGRKVEREVGGGRNEPTTGREADSTSSCKEGRKEGRKEDEERGK
jgi:hypothetical protein